MPCLKLLLLRHVTIYELEINFMIIITPDPKLTEKRTIVHFSENLKFTEKRTITPPSLRQYGGGGKAES